MLLGHPDLGDRYYSSINSPDRALAYYDSRSYLYDRELALTIVCTKAHAMGYRKYSYSHCYCLASRRCISKSARLGPKITVYDILTLMTRVG